MKSFRKMLIISVICITVITASVIMAEYSFIMSNGEGCVFTWASNPENNATVNGYVDEWIYKNFLGIRYVIKYENANFRTDEKNSNGEINTGAYYLDIGNPFITGPENGNYRGAESKTLHKYLNTWNDNPHTVSSWASAQVVPDDDNDTGHVEVKM